MWFTLPRKEASDAAEVAEGASRSDQPTYEDTWYQILRGREEEEAAAQAEGTTAEGGEDTSATEDDLLAAPQHASSLD